jgi:hypothetical protein
MAAAALKSQAVWVRPPQAPGLPDAPINDLTYLRTAQSLEHTAIDVYETALGLGVLDAATTTVVRRFVADHRRHSGALGQLITGLGGQTFTCANPWIMERAIVPILDRIQGSDDVVFEIFLPQPTPSNRSLELPISCSRACCRIRSYARLQ